MQCFSFVLTLTFSCRNTSSQVITYVLWHFSNENSRIYSLSSETLDPDQVDDLFPHSVLVTIWIQNEFISRPSINWSTPVPVRMYLVLMWFWIISPRSLPARRYSGDAPEVTYWSHFWANLDTLCFSGQIGLAVTAPDMNWIRVPETL